MNVLLEAEMVILWLNKKSSVKQLTPSPGEG